MFSEKQLIQDLISFRQEKHQRRRIIDLKRFHQYKTLQIQVNPPEKLKIFGPQ